MQQPSQISCPVDVTTVNEYRVRFTAALICLLCAVFLVTGAWQIPAFMGIDFSARAFFNPRYSLLARMAGWLTQVAQTGVKPVNGAPKRFAAGIGFFLSLSMLALALLHQQVAAEVNAGVIGVFALLESAAGFCAGCYVYHYYNKIVRGAQ